MLRILFLRYFLAVSVLAIVCIFLPGNGFGKNIRRYPCDPKFGYTGNYLELTTGSVAHAKGVQICFSRAASEKLFEKRWWEFWKTKEINQPVNPVKKSEVCLQSLELPGRYQKPGGKWTKWRKGLPVNQELTTFQFALCGEIDDLSIWKTFHRHNGVDSWDDMRIVSSGNEDVYLDKLRIVQNRVRILDNEKSDEGLVRFLLKGGVEENDSIPLADRIRRTKLNRIHCLNLQPGPPYCEKGIPGLEDQEEIPAVITTALLELGHSGSKKYRRENNAYCSEFSFYVIEKATQLSTTCNKMIPNPAREDVNVKDMFRWFKMCKKLIPRNEIKAKIKAGDFISVDNLGHSAIFLGWADPEKEFFWELSGNNRCRPERETFYAPKHKANMVCISKREFTKHILTKDFGGIVAN